MGNWMRVEISGTCAEAEVEALKRVVRYEIMDDGDQHFGPLSSGGGLLGLSLWPATRFHDVGNCAERDYTAQDVAADLEFLANTAPSLCATVHCGADYESPRCEATVTLAEGKATVGPPEVEALPEINDDAIRGRVLKHLWRPVEG
jgi:hypothetical protein